MFVVLKGAAKLYVRLSGALYILSLSLLAIPATSASNLAPININASFAPIEIRDCIPQEDAGIISFARVPADTSFAVLIRSVHAIDINSANAIRFHIDDSIYRPYMRNLNSNEVRVIKLDDSPDGQSTFFWAVYDRFLESYIPPSYTTNSFIYIIVRIQDMENNILQPEAFEFKIDSAAEQTASLQNSPKTEEIYLFDQPFNDSHDASIQVVEGELAGAKVTYNSWEPLTPKFESSDAIEEVSLAGLQALGRPLNLAPHTVFDTPVTLFVPIPEDVDIRSVGLAYYDGTQWLLAMDAAGNVLLGGEGWLVPGSRVDHEASSPALVEVKVHHFSGTQAVVFASFSGTWEEEDRPPSGSGAVVFVSCFVDSVSSGSRDMFWFLSFIVRMVILTFGLRYCFTDRINSAHR